jgi:outer membrane protein assembly factor BamB
MKYLILITFFIACRNDNPVPVYYQKGDFWPEKFRSNGLPGKVLFKDKLYCSTIEIDGDHPNYLYCLDLKTGLVDWTARVKNWASAPPVITDSFIYYCSFVGDLYKFDKKGKQLWYRQADGPYGIHTMDPLNNHLFVRTVSNGVFEYDNKTGDSLAHYGNGLGATLPVFDSSYMLIGDIKEDGVAYLVCYDLKTRKPVWKIPGETGTRRLFTDNHRVYYTDKDQAVCCRNIPDGELVWKTDSLSETGNMLQSLDPIMVFEPNSLFYSEGITKTVFEFNKSNGEKTGKYTFSQLKLSKRIQPLMQTVYTYDNGDEAYKMTVSYINMLSDYFNHDLQVELLPLRNNKQ